VRASEEASYWYRRYSAGAAGNKVTSVEKCEVVFSEIKEAQPLPLLLRGFRPLRRINLSSAGRSRSAFSTYSCFGLFPPSFALAQACCNASACPSGDLKPFITSWKPAYITSLKFCGASTSML
jgi:hypothetical protein